MPAKTVPRDCCFVFTCAVSSRVPRRHFLQPFDLDHIRFRKRLIPLISTQSTVNNNSTSANLNLKPSSYSRAQKSVSQVCNLERIRLCPLPLFPLSVLLSTAKSAYHTKSFKMGDIDKSRRNATPRSIKDSERAKLEEFIDSIGYSAR